MKLKQGLRHDAAIRTAYAARYRTSDPASLAYDTARKRWPVILTGAIDDMYRSVLQCDDADKREEGKCITESIARLKYELLHDRAMTPLIDDGGADIPGYNAFLEELQTPGWMDVEWLYSECYLYRRLQTEFALSKHWKHYDVFARQKIRTFRSSRPAVLELAARYRDLITQLRADAAAGTAEDVAKERILFVEMCEICLWGNATDLSLFTNLTFDDIQKLQGSEARKAAEKNIVVNDLSKAFDILQNAKTAGKEARRVDVVLDNAGFELYVDLVLAGYLIATGLATEVILHPKDMPWFVSDVVPQDFASLLAALADPKTFYETQSDDELLVGQVPPPLGDKDADSLAFVFSDWRGLHEDGKLILRPNEFWTRGTDFRNMTADKPDLAADLATSELVIFKGDLNYRKLTGDMAWDPTTPFAHALGNLGSGSGSGINVLALRTCKADVVVGLAPGDDERLKATESDDPNDRARRWGWRGKWAVVSLYQGKAS